MKINPKYIQLIGDAVLPLAGFFFWNWSLYFILLFYFIDVLASEVIAHLKSNKVQAFQGAYLKNKWMNHSLFSASLLVLMLIATHFGVYLIQKDIDFISELIAFWTYTEMGIQQGYILVPLLAFAAYQQYKMTFLLTSKYKTESISSIWKPQFTGYIVAIVSAVLIGGVGFLVDLPTIVYVFVTVLGVSIFRFIKS